jgi:aspartate/methionine/tyrosine aminotransferase
VNRILAEMRQLQGQGRHIVSLMRGEPDFATPGPIAAAAESAIRAGRTRYPDNRGEPALRNAIAGKLQRDNGVSYDAGSEILVTTGATLGIQAALLAVVNEGDEILLPDPVYDAYASPVHMAGGTIRSIPCPMRAGRFVLDADAVEAAVTPRSRVLIVNTPWNPVGTVFSEQELRALAAVIERHQLTLISDEIYEAITYGDARHRSRRRCSWCCSRRVADRPRSSRMPQPRRWRDRRTRCS